MNIAVLLFIAIIFFLGLALILFMRSWLVLLMLLLASQMLGFVDPMAFTIGGAFDIHALLALFIAFSIIFSVAQFKDLKHAVLKKPILVFLLLWTYGVIYPVFKNHSSLFYSLKASKEFLMIFSYFAVFLSLRTERDVKWGWNFLIYLGIYYSVVEIFAQFFGSTLIHLMTYHCRKEAFVFWKIYPPFWPVILLSFLYFYFEFALGIRRLYFRTGLTSIGLLLTFFRSYLLGTFVAAPLVLILSRKRATNVFLKGISLISVISLTILFVAVVTGSGMKMLKGLSEEFIFSGIKEFSTQSGGALAGREVYAKERKKVLEKSPYIGYGFIDKDSHFGKVLRYYVKGDMLGFIDKGNLDVALKFGYVGSVILYGTILYLIVLLLKLAKRNLSPVLCVRLLTVATMLMVFIIVQPVHAALTYSFSLLPLGIALGLIEREHFLLKKNEKESL